MALDLGLSFEANKSKSTAEEESKTSSTGTKTGTQINSGSVDVGTVMNSGRVDTSDAMTFNTGRTDKQTTDQLTTNSGQSVTGGSTSTTAGSTNVTTVGARENVTNMSSSTYNSGRTDTSQVILTEQAVDRLIQQMMEGTQGLQAVSAGQKQSGGYNTTASTLLTNDLMARVGGEVAVRGAKTVNITGSSSSSTTGRSVESIGAIETTQVIGPSSTSNIFNQLTSGSTSRVQGTNITAVGSSSSGTSATNVMGESSSQSTNQRGGSRTDIYEEEKKQVESQARKDSSTTEVKSKAKISIICTHLHTKKLMPSPLYYLAARSFLTYPEHVHRGYYYWAVPVLTYMIANPTATKTKFYTWLLNSRCRGVVGDTSCNPVRWYDRIVASVTYTICNLLGKTVAKNYSNTETIAQVKGS